MMRDHTEKVKEIRVDPIPTVKFIIIPTRLVRGEIIWIVF